MGDDIRLTERVLVPMSKDMVEAIKDYWHANRLDSKSVAVRELIEVGLQAKSRWQKTIGESNE